MVERIRRADAPLSPDQQRILEGPALRALRQGQLIRDGRVYDITPPSRRSTTQSPYRFNPALLLLQYSDLTAVMTPAELDAFEQWASQVRLPGGQTLARSLAKPLAIRDVLPETIPPRTRAMLQHLRSHSHTPPPDHVLATLEDLPEHFVPGGAIATRWQPSNLPEYAYYDASSSTINTHTSPASWGGMPETVLHEYAHRVDDALGIATRGADPALLDAIRKDAANLPAWQHQEEFWGWLTQHFPGSSMSTMWRRVRFADSVLAATGRYYGLGHRPSYFASDVQRATEIWAHAYTALFDGDPVWYRHFQHTAAYTRGKLLGP